MPLGPFCRVCHRLCLPFFLAVSRVCDAQASERGAPPSRAAFRPPARYSTHRTTTAKRRGPCATRTTRPRRSMLAPESAIASQSAPAKASAARIIARPGRRRTGRADAGSTSAQRRWGVTRTPRTGRLRGCPPARRIRGPRARHEARSRPSACTPNAPTHTRTRGNPCTARGEADPRAAPSPRSTDTKPSACRHRRPVAGTALGSSRTPQPGSRRKAMCRPVRARPHDNRGTRSETPPAAPRSCLPPAAKG